jgi:hypothetical protein
MSAAKQAAERNVVLHAAKETVGKLLPVAALGAGAYGLSRLARRPKAHYGKMLEHAGDEFTSLSDKDKKRVPKIYESIAKHSPTVAGDPMASWNHVRAFVNTPTQYGAQFIEQLQKVEGSRPSTLRGILLGR